LRKAGNIEAALTAHRRAIELQPELASAYNNLGSVFIDQGQAEEAIRAYRNALACSQGKLDSCRAQYHSALIYTLHLHPDYDGRKLFTEASQWSRQNAEPLAYETVPHRNNRSPDRKLKIGYVSSDFSMHPVGRFMLPIIEHHDRNHFELHIFSNVKRPDDMTTRFQQAVDFWHDIRSLTDAAAAELIRKFGIDILIDLGLHTGDNRLLIFARKPAPVQATYLAYCGTSGMRAMDYLICDPHLIPTDANTACFSEKLSPLPNTYWCYRPPIETGDVGPLPALTAGHITFGCLNNFGKISANALDIWCQLLKAVPGTTLLLHAKEGSHRQKVRDAICAAGIDPARLDFVPSLPLPEYFDLYHRVDIGLDPFPFTGGTTSCDSIWMGVPVITLAGQTPVSRGGLSILSNVGLTELVAHSMEEYLRLAIELATDLPRLSKLRATLRDRMRASPLMQEQKFTADLESAYRSMWKTWCAVITVFDNSGA
jgi:predicted O-linked N-acetylglucosamine transferase (SPINDLY family)